MSETTESSLETGMFLKALARLSNAQRIVEIGCYLGHSTEHLLAAAVKNGGTLVALDTEEKHLVATRQRCGDDGRLLLMDPSELTEPLPADFVFLDPDPKSIYVECFERYVAPMRHCLLVAHDTTLMREQCRGFLEWVRERPWRQIELPWHRGHYLAVIE